MEGSYFHWIYICVEGTISQQISKQMNRVLLNHIHHIKWYKENKTKW